MRLELRLMRTLSGIFLPFVLFLICVASVSAVGAQGQSAAATNAAGAATPSPAGPMAPANLTGTASTVSTSAAMPVAVAQTPQIDAKTAVQAITSMFTLNSSVNVEATGKPLVSTGSWGAQTQFPSGPPKPCALARVPCVKVIYRVAESSVVCEWTVGQVTVVEVKPGQESAHVVHTVVLDENAAAAQYTLRRAWASGEAMPTPTAGTSPQYPKIARDAGVGGVVTVRLIVGPDGVVKSAVATAGSKLLQTPVVEAVHTWRFSPLAIGDQPTSFQLDEQFTYSVGKTDFTDSMNPSGKIIEAERDPRNAPGFNTAGVSSGRWQSCNSTGCVTVSPLTPQ
jgi:TonB family protein